MIALADEERIVAAPGKLDTIQMIAAAIFFSLAVLLATVVPNIEIAWVIGMLTGLGYLQLFGYYLRKTHYKQVNSTAHDEDKAEQMMGDVVPFDVFNKVARAEWDTLLFFYGVVLCVGGLGFIGTSAWHRN